MTIRTGQKRLASADLVARRHQNKWLPLSVVTLLLLSPAVVADDWPDFDRPGILFAPSVLPVGVWSVELGLPDISRTKSDDVRVLESELHSMFRYGFAANWEVQFDFSPWVRERLKTSQGSATQTGYSDSRLGLRYDASETMAAWFAADAVALQAGVTLNTGHSAFKATDNEIDLGIVASWQLPATGHEVGAMLQWHGDSGDSTWFLATTYGLPISDSLSAFVEAGAWFGDEKASVAGIGVIWRPSAGFQVDSYLLSRLSGEIADTQMGLGVSWMFF